MDEQLQDDPPEEEVSEGTDAEAEEAAAEAHEAATDAQVAATEAQVEDVLAENARLKAELEATKAEVRRGGRLRTARKILVGVLVALSCVAVVTGVVAYWTHETLLDTEQFMTIVGPLGEDPAVQQMIADETTTQIIDGLQIQTRVENVLPGSLDLLSAPITNAVRDFTQTRMETFTQSDQFTELWTKTFTVAHQGAVRLVRDEAPNVAVVDGEVRLNIMPFIAKGLERVGQGAADLFGLDVNVDLPELSTNPDPSSARARLAQRLGISLPENFGTIRIMSEEQLTAIQDAVKWFDVLVYLLVALPFILIALAIGLSLNRRRTLVEIGLAVAAAFLVGRAVVNRVQQSIVSGITDPTTRGAAKTGVATVLDSIRSITVWVIVIAIVVAVAAYLLGRPRWFGKLIAWVRDLVRRRPSGSQLETMVAAHYDYLRAGSIAVAAILLFWIGIGWLSVIVLGLLLTAFLWDLSVLRARVTVDAAPLEVDQPDDGPPSLPPPDDVTPGAATT